MVRRAAALLAALLLGSGSQICLAEATARVDRDVLRESETFDLVIEVDRANVPAEPDLTPIEGSFEILSRSRRSSIEVVNGETVAHTSFLVTLAPKEPGVFRIPPIAVGAETTNVVTVEVTPEGPGSGSEAEIFLEAEAEPLAPYIQSQVTYSVRLLHAIDIREGSLSEPDLPGALVERLGDDMSYEAKRDGRTYRVIERRYAIFPQASGPLGIPPPIFNGQVPRARPDSGARDGFGQRGGGFGTDPFGIFFRPTRPVRVRGPRVELRVHEAPLAFPGKVWLPAESLVLKDAWAGAPVSFRVGEPLTRTITVTARGITGPQLPDLEPGTHPSLKMYPDRPDTKTFSEGAHVIGKREFKLALVPTAAGTFTLPAVELPWWNTRTDEARVATLAAQTIVVQPAPGGESASAGAEGSAQRAAVTAPAERVDSGAASRPWLLWALLGAWLATLCLWLADRRRLQRSRARTSAEEAPTTGAARRRLESACREGDAIAARDALLDWAKARWPERAPVSLIALAARIDSDAAKASLTGLDQALYGSATQAWSDPALYANLAPALSPPRPRAPHASENLPALYPRP